jgi:heat shock protein HslJ
MGLMRLLLLTTCLAASFGLPASAEDTRQWRVERVWSPAQGTTVALTPEASALTSGAISLLGKLTLETGCNTVYARGWPSGKQIKFGKPWTTKKACNGEALAIESGLVEGLALARAYENPKHQIILRDERGKEVLALAKR